MELFFFNAYCKLKKDIPDYHKSRHPVFITAILIGLGLTAMILYYVSLSKECKAGEIVCIIIELLAAIILFVYSESFYLKTSFDDLEKLKSYCKILYDNLCKIGMSGSQDCVSQVKQRIEKHIASIESENLKRKNDKRFISEIFFAPLLLTTYSLVSEKRESTSELIATALTLVICIYIVVAFIKMCQEAMYFYRTYRLVQLKQFALDLQGILDTQFDNSLVENLEEIITPSSTINTESQP